MHIVNKNHWKNAERETWNDVTKHLFWGWKVTKYFSRALLAKLTGAILSAPPDPDDLDFSLSRLLIYKISSRPRLSSPFALFEIYGL